MPVQLNHTIIWCHDRMRSSAFLAAILGRPAPRAFLHFMIVDLDNDVSLDFMEKDGEIALQHYAFLIEDGDFDAALARVKAEGLIWWADPARTQPHAINHYGGGRGFYFEDPNGHLLEFLTKAYPHS